MVNSIVVAVRCAAAAVLACLVMPAAQAKPPSIDDFLRFSGINEVALSPDGRHLAVVQDTEEDRHVRALVIYRIKGLEIGFHKAYKVTEKKAYNLWWVNNDRLFVTLQGYDPETDRTIVSDGHLNTWYPPKIISFDANLENKVVLMEGDRSFMFTFHVAQYLHRLPDDPEHVLMALHEKGEELGVYKVNVAEGTAERVQRGNRYTYDWMVDWDGDVRMRIDFRRHHMTFAARNSPDGEWFEIARYRHREIPEIAPLAFSPDPNILYVVARNEGDRLAIFEYDMRERKLGRLIFSHPEVDVRTALFTRTDHRLIGFRYVVHKPRARFIEKRYTDFNRTLERKFGEKNFAAPVGTTTDERLMVIRVTGPSNPGTYYLYDTNTDKAQKIGVSSTQLESKQLGNMRPVVYKARDGMEINAYFTTPPGDPERPPLVVIPHGGPEARDYLEWDTRVQFLATRGYAVLQPNFRGSDGYGKKFVEAGHKEWGLKMQDDITDGVRHLIEQGLVDPERICIAGWSYGGYAALAGAAFTPDLYKCAISINGIGDLYGLAVWKRDRTYAFHFWEDAVGDPGDSEDRKRLKDRSPANAANRIKAPILLMAGEEDRTIPATQTEAMAEALEEAGKTYTYIEFENEWHTFRTYKDRKRMYKEIESFLARHIGRRRRPEAAPPGEPPPSP